MRGRIKPVPSVLLLALVCAGGCDHQREQPAPRLSHAVYVWHRVWDDGVRTAIHQAEGVADGFVVLAAEIGWDGRGRPQMVRVPVDVSFLKKVTKPVGIAIRIGEYRGNFIRDAAALNLVVSTVADVLAAACSNGLHVAEVQIDYDCAESRLAEYLHVVRFIRPRIGPVPLIITALPCWLDSPDCAALMRSVDGFVLQVHSLERPVTAGAPIILCDPGRAGRWVRQAGRLGISFRVALPTYGYRAAVAPDGHVLGISTEAGSREDGMAPGAVEIRSDPVAMAELVQRWMAEPPPNMQGVLWYRLPVAGERLNWKWETLSLVMAGIIPDRKLVVRVVHPEPSLAEIEIVNAGAIDAVPPTSVSLVWTEGRLVGADGLAGFECVRGGDDRATLQFPTTATADIVGVGERLKIGWFRFDRPIGVKVDGIRQ